MTVDRSGDRELELGPPTGTNVIQFHVIFLEFGYEVATPVHTLVARTVCGRRFEEFFFGDLPLGLIISFFQEG